MANPKVNTILGNMTEAEAQEHVNKVLAEARQKKQAPTTVNRDLVQTQDLPPDLAPAPPATAVEIPLNDGTHQEVERLHAEYSARCQSALEAYNQQVALVLRGFTSHFNLEDGRYMLSIDRKSLVKQ